MHKTRFIVESDKKTLVFERSFDASKSRVWEAYTVPELLAKWWGPRGWDTEIKHMDFSDGGYWHYGMTCTDPDIEDWFGKTSWSKVSYRNIKPQDSFEYSDAFCDENGVVTPGMPVSRTLLTLREADGVTTVIGRTEYATPEALAQVLQMGMEEGFSQTWDRLEESLAA